LPTDHILPPAAGGLPASGVDLNEVERNLLVQAMNRSGNNLSRAARLLGIGRGALRYRLEKHNLAAK